MIDKFVVKYNGEENLRLLNKMSYSILPPPPRSHSRLLKNRRSRRRNVKIIGALVTAGFIFFVVSILATALAFGYFAKDLPSPTKLTDRTPAQSTKIYDRNGKLLYNIYGDQNRTLVTLDKIPKDLQHATISIEDKNFYTNQGFDLTGIARSIYDLIVHHRILGGGSTLTQQLVKNALLTNEQTITRKIKEIILAIQIDRRYSKDQILQIYLNEIPYGGTAWGVEAASNQYFGKDVSQLNLTESAILAGLPQAPSTYSPFGSDPKAYIGRTTAVLRRMREDGYITKDQEAKSLKELPDVKFASFGHGILAPHFAIYVKNLLEQKYGEKRVLQGGLQVTTTLDLDIQNQAQKVVTDQINKAKALKVGNGAAVVENTKTGEILALVGSKDYFATDIQGNFDVATQGLRQPGSALKPFNYLTGFEKGYTPSTLWLDQKTDFGNGYTPENYDSNYFVPGQTRIVLANSLNIPAVEHLAVIGLPSMLKTLSDFGITTLNKPDTYGLSLTLGGGAIKLDELTNAYAILGNQGKYHPFVTILKVTDANGKVLEQFQPKDGPQLAPVQDVYMINNILSDKVAKYMDYGTYWANRLHFRDGIGVKTGTSEYKTDNWTFGYTNSYTVGVWVGNNDNSPMNPALASGVTGAAPIYHDIMVSLLNGKPQENFPRPNGIVDAQVDSLTGMRPNPNLPAFPTKTEIFDKNNLPPIDDMHVKVRICKPSGLLSTPACEAAGQAVDQIYVVMYDPYSKEFQNGKTLCNPCPPTQPDNTIVAPVSQKPTVTITTTPTAVAGTLNTKTFTVNATVTPSAGAKITQVVFSVGTSPPKTATVTTEPYQVKVTVPSYGTYTITATATDDAGNVGTATPLTLIIAAP